MDGSKPSSPQTLLDRLLELYPNAKRTTLRQMIEARRVLINGKPARTLKQPIEPSDEIRVNDRVAVSRQPAPKRLPFAIVYEDNDILVIDKPAGWLTSTVPREKRPTALAKVREYVLSNDPQAQVGLIHRLDRDASGLLVFSKNHQAYLSLKQQFARHSVDRIYLAVVKGLPNPREGTIDSHLVERADGSVHSSDNPRKGERAVTHYQTLSQTKHRAWLRVKLQTGKKHQIRAHLSERGVPIVNDPVYSKEKPTGRLMLAAVELSLDHPRIEKRMNFIIEPGADFDQPVK